MRMGYAWPCGALPRAKLPCVSRARGALNWCVLLIATLCCAGRSQASVNRHTEDHAFFPLDMVLFQAETLLDAEDAQVFSAEYFNRLAGALTLHGRFVEADRALASSLRLDPKQGDALYLLALLRCIASRFGEARDALHKAYHSRAVSNLFEVAAINSDQCARLPLLFPGDAVSHERSYSLFPHYSHTERFYVVQRDPGDEIRRCVPSAPWRIEKAPGEEEENPLSALGEVHPDLAVLTGTEAMLSASTVVARTGVWSAWTGETLIKQSSGDAALREAIAFAMLGHVSGGKYSDLFPVVVDNPQLLLAVADARGRWSAYEVEEVHAIHSPHFVGEVLKNGGWGQAWAAQESERQEGQARKRERRVDIRALVPFVEGCLQILEGLQAAGVVHNNLNAEALLVREVDGRVVPIMVDAEIAAVPGLAAPTSCSLSHAREFHKAGAPSDAHTLGRCKP
jgi:hypothetical protein